MKEYKILYYNNGVGLKTDANLLTELFKSYNIKCDEIILHDNIEIKNSDIGIWIQNFYEHLLDKFKVNVFYINEEWSYREISLLKKFDVILCKNKFTYDMLKDELPVVYLPFFSKDLNIEVNPKNKFLHFAGKSIQKNTESTIPNVNNLTILDPNSMWNYLKNENYKYNHITSYISDSELKTTLNDHSVHICCSLYESWGHYLFEGLSTGAEIICSEIPVFLENLDPDLVHFLPTFESPTNDRYYMYKDEKNLYKFRKSFYIKEQDLSNLILNFEPKGSPEKRKRLFESIMSKNKIKTVKFFTNL